MKSIRQHRQLAAIVFTDIVGYTALMGKDTDKALELVRISKEIQRPLVEKHNGQWLKEGRKTYNQQAVHYSSLIFLILQL